MANRFGAHYDSDNNSIPCLRATRAAAAERDDLQQKKRSAVDLDHELDKQAKRGFKIRGIPGVTYYAPGEDIETSVDALCKTQQARKHPPKLKRVPSVIETPSLKEFVKEPLFRKLPLEDLTQRHSVVKKNFELTMKLEYIRQLIVNDQTYIQIRYPTLSHVNRDFVQQHFPKVIEEIQDFPEVLENYSPQGIYKYVPYVDRQMAVFIHRLANHTSAADKLPVIIPDVDLWAETYKFTVATGSNVTKQAERPGQNYRQYH